MLSKDLKKLLKLSGGKIILSEGDLKDSFVVMKLNEYLREKEEGLDFEDYCDEDDYDEECFCHYHENEKDLDFEGINEVKGSFSSPEELTDEELLSRINVDIAELKERRNEDMLDDLEADDKNKDPKYEKV